MASSLEKLEQSHAVEIEWRSFELRPKDAPPISATYRAKIEANRPRVYAIAHEQYGLEMNPGPFGIDSRPALIGAKYAESQGAGPAYHAAIMQGYWQEAKDLDDEEVLVECAVQAGLETEAFRRALGNPEYERAVLADVAQAHDYGIQGVPGMIFENKYLISGAQPYEVLSRAVEQIQAEEAKE